MITRETQQSAEETQYAKTLLTQIVSLSRIRERATHPEYPYTYEQRSAKVEEVLPLLTHPNLAIQEEAVWTLTALGGQKAFDALWMQAQSTESPSVAGSIALALGHYGGSYSLVPLTELAAHPDKGVRRAAHIAISFIAQKAERGEAFGELTAYPETHPQDPRVKELVERIEGDEAYQALVHEMKAQAQDKMLLPKLVTRLADIIGVEKIDPNTKQPIRQIEHYDVDTNGLLAISETLNGTLGTTLEPKNVQTMINAGGVAAHFNDGTGVHLFGPIYDIMIGLEDRFERIDTRPSGKRTLCGVTACVDVITNLEGSTVQQQVENALADAIADEGKGAVYRRINDILNAKTLSEALQQDGYKAVMQNIKAALGGRTIAEAIEKDGKEIVCSVITKLYPGHPDKVTTKAEVIGILLWSFTHKGGKITVPDMDLASWIREKFPPTKSQLGGAAATQAQILKKNGEDVRYWSSIHSDIQAEAFTVNVPFETFGDTEVYANDVSAADPTKASKINQPVEYPKGMTITIPGINGGEPIVIQKSDRIIFVAPYFDPTGKTVQFYPFFRYPDLKTIPGNYDLVFINGIQYIAGYKELVYQKAANVLRLQLEALNPERLAGGRTDVRIHVEFSGSVKDVQYMYDVLRGRITSFGINEQELMDVVKNLHNLYPQDIMFVEGNTIHAYYQNAHALASFLGVDRFFLHGPDCYLTLVKNQGTQEEIEQKLEIEQAAAWKANRKVLNLLTAQELQLTPLLKKEGFDMLMDFGLAIAKEIEPNPWAEYTHYQIAKEIVAKGYYYYERNGYSVVITPIKWLYDQGLIKGATGAGDTTSLTNAVNGI